jgi:hypothetical protein
MSEKVVLSSLDDPKFDLELPNGETKSYDLWDLIDKIQEIEEIGKPKTIKEQVSAIRKLFGFPDPDNTAISGDKKKGEKPEFTLSKNQAIALNKKFAEIIEQKLGKEKKSQGSNVR